MRGFIGILYADTLANIHVPEKLATGDNIAWTEKVTIKKDRSFDGAGLSDNRKVEQFQCGMQTDKYSWWEKLFDLENDKHPALIYPLK